MTTSKRIVLLDNWGDELFSGVSLSSLPPAPSKPPVDTTNAEHLAHLAHDDEEEPPPTLRSSVFVRYEAKSEILHVSEVEPETLRKASGMMPIARGVEASEPIEHNDNNRAA